MNWLNNISPFVGLFMLLAGIPTFLTLYKVTQDLNLSIIITIIYEMIVIISGFIGKVWQKVQDKWVDRLAEWIDLTLQSIFSGYQSKYFTYISYQHRFFDVKGLRTQGPYNLDLEKVFVHLSVDPTPIHQATSNPLQGIPEHLRSGTHTIWKYINSRGMDNHNLVILGAPGSGKTTLLKHIALTLTMSRRRRKRIGAPLLMPVLLFVRDHASDITKFPDIKLAKLIRDQFERRQAPVPPTGWLESQLEQGNCLIMFDGLDEVADITIRRNVVKWVEECMGAYGRNRFILSSRPHGYKTNPLANVTVLQVKPFTSFQVKQFVQNWYIANEIMSSQRNDPGVQTDAKLGADDLLTRIYNTPTLSELSVNPLLLTMIATVHRFRSSLPGRRVELYAEICEVFLGKRRESRGLASDLTPGQKQRVLQPLAYYLMQENTREIKQADIEPIIKKHLDSVSPNIQCADFVKDIENSSGLFVERESGEYTFSHQTFQEYLAAVHILENGLESELVANINKSWWHESIRLYCAQTDASGIIQACLNSKTAQILGLAIDCMDEAREVNSDTRHKYDDMIKRGIESPEPELRHQVAEARLSTRLNKHLYRIDDNTYIDTSLITCAEYQLFLDEMCARETYCQPDDWKSYKFPEGLANDSVLGVRPSDAFDFCEWLTQREGKTWRYRIPSPEESILYPLNHLKNSRSGYWVVPSPASPATLWRTSSSEDFIFTLDLTRDRSVAQTFALDANRSLIGSINPAENPEQACSFSRALALIREGDSNLVKAIDRILVRDQGKERFSTINFDLAMATSLEQIRIRVTDIARSRTNELTILRINDINLMSDIDLKRDLQLAKSLVYAREQSLRRVFHSMNEKIELLRIQEVDVDLLLLGYIDVALNILILQLRRTGVSMPIESVRIVKERLSL